MADDQSAYDQYTPEHINLAHWLVMCKWKQLEFMSRSNGVGKVKLQPTFNNFIHWEVAQTSNKSTLCL